MIKFEEKTLTTCSTGSPIIKYEIIFDNPEHDGYPEGYMLHFENGYRMELDRDEINEEELDWLIKNKIYININFRISIYKGDIKQMVTGSRNMKTVPGHYRHVKIWVPKK